MIKPQKNGRMRTQVAMWHKPAPGACHHNARRIVWPKYLFPNLENLKHLVKHEMSQPPYERVIAAQIIGDHPILARWSPTYDDWVMASGGERLFATVSP